MYLTVIIFTVFASTNAQVLKSTHIYLYLHKCILCYRVYSILLVINLHKFHIDNIFSGLVCRKWQTFWSSTGKLAILYNLKLWNSGANVKGFLSEWDNSAIIYNFRNSINTMMNTWLIEDWYAPEEQPRNGSPWLL